MPNKRAFSKFEENNKHLREKNETIKELKAKIDHLKSLNEAADSVTHTMKKSFMTSLDQSLSSFQQAQMVKVCSASVNAMFSAYECDQVAGTRLIFELTVKFSK